MQSLTILILSYRRPEFLYRLLDEITKQIEGSEYENNINISVRINPSEISYEKVIKVFKNKNYINIKTNKRNIGPYKSLRLSLKEINTDFLWWIGDDDNIHKYAIKIISSKLNKYIKYIILNHDRVSLINGVEEYKKPYFNQREINLKNNPIFYLKKNAFSIGLISCMIYRTEYYKDCIYYLSENNKKDPTIDHLFPLAIALISISNDKDGLFINKLCIQSTTNNDLGFPDKILPITHYEQGIKTIEKLLIKQTHNRYRTGGVIASLRISFLYIYAIKQLVVSNSEDTSNYIKILCRIYSKNKLTRYFLKNIFYFIRYIIRNIIEIGNILNIQKASYYYNFLQNSNKQ